MIIVIITSPEHELENIIANLSKVKSTIGQCTVTHLFKPKQVF